MKTVILKFQILLIIHNLGSKCDKIIQNTTFFVDNGATVVLNCTCFRENESSWNGPDGLNALSNDTLIPYSDGIQISPNLNISNIDIYGNYSIGKCHLKINNFSKTNDGIYLCSYICNGSFQIRKYNIYSKRPPTNLKIINVTEKNIAYGKEGVQMNLTCTVNNGIPSATLIWSKDGLAVSNGSRDSLLYQLTPTRFDHLQNMTCNANSDLLTSPLSQTIYLDILYRPYLTTTQQKDGLLIEGQSTVLCCHSNSNPPAHYMSWDKNYHEIYSWRQSNTTKLDGMNKDFCLPIYTVYRNHTGNYTCVAENSIAKSNSSLSINVLYPPDVIVTSIISEQKITLHCVADGKPDNYTFYDWEHKSEFKEHIRCIHGTQKGQLVIDKSQKGKENENDGIYMCTVSNGISHLEVKTKQKGQKVIKSHAPPVFVAYNKPVRYGQYGQKLKLKIHVYDRLYNCKVLIKMNDTTLKVKTKKEMIITYDTFHGVNITVWGQQFTFDLPLTSANDFRNYTVEACNDVGCNYFDVQVQSAYFIYKSEMYCNLGWKIVGILFGGILILSICLHIYCLLKRKRRSRMVPEIPLEVQYDEIGIIYDNSASIQTLSNNVQEAETSVDGPAVEDTYPHLTSLEQNDSSDNSVQSLSTSMLKAHGDGYENPYQSIDPADIEIHPYSTVGSYLYQNTIIFPRQISSRNPIPIIPIDEKRVPWLVIYKKTCVNAWT